MIKINEMNGSKNFAQIDIKENNEKGSFFLSLFGPESFEVVALDTFDSLKKVLILYEK